MKKIYLYLLDTMADWESGYLLQAFTLQKRLPKQKYQLCTVGILKQPIKTAGSIMLLPDITIDQIEINEAAALLLIGADTWLEQPQQKILNIASKFIEKGILIAAICGATLELANMGLLDTRFHTSNAPFFLSEMAPNYKGKANYQEDTVVLDKNLVTASSAGSLLWAKYILEYLNLFPQEAINSWYSYFATGNAFYFEKLTAILQK